MNMYILTDKAICLELGSRLKALRLHKNISQQALAKATYLSLNTIKSLESGKGKLLNLITVLRELGALDQVDNFIPDIKISPLQLAKRQGRQRLRATGLRGNEKD